MARCATQKRMRSSEQADFRTIALFRSRHLSAKEQREGFPPHWGYNRETVLPGPYRQGPPRSCWPIRLRTVFSHGAQTPDLNANSMLVGWTGSKPSHLYTNYARQELWE
jgi:hypothetical protein